MATALPEGVEVARTEHFVFRDNVLLNLHHFLYQWATIEALRDGTAERRRSVAVEEIDGPSELDATELAAWRSAIDWYRRDAIEKDLLFNGDMYRLKGQLSDIEDADGEWPGEVDGDYARALRAVLPVYRRHFWPQHHRVNVAWAKAAVVELERYGATIADRLTKAYGGTWPNEPIRVDLVYYANWAGAYTTGDPDHIVQSTTSDDTGNWAKLETLFHEASHTRSVFGAMQSEIDAPFPEQAPRDLWHVLLFMTAGHTVKRTAAEAGDEDYVEYGERNGLYGRGIWAELYTKASPHWASYLQGDLTRTEALSRIAAAFGE
ncbi:MAG: hypothetical protein RL885_26275 [Planctomycetota bacterium]